MIPLELIIKSRIVQQHKGEETVQGRQQMERCGVGWLREWVVGVGYNAAGRPSINQIMINPFISNNDSNYLFRKNYQFIAKPQPPPPPTSFSSSKLNLLHSKNPFTPSSTPIVTSAVPSRSLSTSRVALGSSSSRDKLLLGKSRLLDEADGWKRELESQERVKLQAYGAEGLRYNAYPVYAGSPYESKQQQGRKYGDRQQPNNIKASGQFNDYYTSYTKPIDVKSPKTMKDNGHHPQYELKSERERNDYYQQPQQPSYPSPSRKNRQHFIDDINEDSDSQNLGHGRRQRSKYEVDMHPIRETQEQQRRSRLDDMFGSEMMEDMFKQSMQHNSYASYYPNDLVESKHSKFVRERETHHRPKNSYLYESDVNRFEPISPPTFTYAGKVYHRIEV